AGAPRGPGAGARAARRAAIRRRARGPAAPMSAILAAAAVAICGAAASSFAPVRGAFRAALAVLFGVGIWSAGYSLALFAFGADARVRLPEDALLVAAGTDVILCPPPRAA